MEILLIWLLCAVAAAVIASAKGRSGFGWLLLGMLIGIFAVIIVACLPNLKAQVFAMTAPDGTVSMIRPVLPPKADYTAFIIAVAITFGGTWVIVTLVKALGG